MNTPLTDDFMPLVQLNFQVPPNLAARVRADARRNNKTLDSVGQVIIGDFFKAYNAEQRARFYDGGRTKMTGRRVRI